jgi:hypothetical protein
LKHVEDVEAGRKENILRGVRIAPSTVWSWAGLIAVALIAFSATRGDEFHQFALGVLVSSVSAPDLAQT